MGTHQEGIGTILVPVERMPTLATAIRERGGLAPHVRDLPDQKLIAQALLQVEGGGTSQIALDSDMETLVVEIKVNGTSSDACDDMEDLYAEYGAWALIHLNSEGQEYRVRLVDGRRSLVVGNAEYSY
jgi:hypothetical protein